MTSGAARSKGEGARPRARRRARLRRRRGGAANTNLYRVVNREHTCNGVEHTEQQQQQMTISGATLLDLVQNGTNRFEARFVEVPIGQEA